MRRLHQIHSAVFLEECQQFGITPTRYGLISALLENPGIDQVTLGNELGIDRNNVTLDLWSDPGGRTKRVNPAFRCSLIAVKIYS